MSSVSVEGNQINGERLTKAIAAKLLCEPNDVLVVNYATSPGSNRGENFICVLFAVEVQAKIKGRRDDVETLHFMVKCLPVSEGRVKFANEVVKVRVANSRVYHTWHMMFD